MRTALEQPLEYETAPNPAAAVIWLHGLGADGHDFAGVVPELGLPAGAAVRFVFPHAPMRAVTINAGFVMRAWYDIAADERGFIPNAAHLAEAVEIVRGLIEREQERGIAAGRVVLAGFSQGGAVALQAGLRHPRRLAGVVALSAPASNLDELRREAYPANADLPIFLAHGRYDPMVPFLQGETAHRQLSAQGRTVEWRAYNLEHSVSLEEIRDIGRFLTRVLG